jgi:hypothetical protein
MPYSYDRSGQIIGGGILQAGEAIGRGIERRSQEKKKEVANAKVADSFFKVNPEALSALDLSDYEYSALSARDRIAAVEGAIQGLTAKRQEAERTQRIELLAQQLLNAKIASQGLQDRGNWMGAFANRAIQPGSTPGDLQAAYLEAAAQYPQGAPEDLLPSIMRYGQTETGGDREFKDYEDPDTGEKFVAYGATMAKSGLNPAKAVTEIKPVRVMDPDSGEVAGYWIGQRYITKDEFTGAKAGQSSVLVQATDDKGNPISGVYQNPKTGQYIQVRAPASSPSTWMGQPTAGVTPMTLEAFKAWKAKRK